MKTLTATGYIIQDKQGTAIFGYGETVGEAWAMVRDGAGPFTNAYGEPKDDERAFAEDFRTFGATAALIAKVQDDGGAIDWEVIGGIACTREEAEADEEA